MKGRIIPLFLGCLFAATFLMSFSIRTSSAALFDDPDTEVGGGSWGAPDTDSEDDSDGGNDIVCETGTTEYPHHYRIEPGSQEEKACNTCRFSGGGLTVGIKKDATTGNCTASIKFSRVKTTSSVTVTDCEYLPNDANAYCTQVRIIKAYVGECADVIKNSSCPCSDTSNFNP